MDFYSGASAARSRRLQWPTLARRLTSRSCSKALLALLPLLAVTGAAGEQRSTPASLPSLPPHAAYGEFAVGVATGFARDAMARFDPWNGVYGSAEYQALLERVDASGQGRTVVFQLWYPALSREGMEQRAARRSPWPASSGRPAGYRDFFFQESDAIVQLGVAGMVEPAFVHLREGPLQALAPADRHAALARIGQQILDSWQGAWQDATPAKGRFPLILLAHGLGGTHAMWSSFAEFLASHGYVVAAPTFNSDSALPLAFHDQNSPYRQQREWTDVLETYQAMASEAKVVPSFYRFLFGEVVPARAAKAGRARALPGGAERATTMMRNLFRQRVADVALVLRTVLYMDADEPSCRTALAAMGATSAAQPVADRYLCGLLNGRIDRGSIGVAGHSLGAMTAQLAANHLPDVRTAFGLNNAPPLTWMPEEMLGGRTALGEPASSRKPLLLMVGDEDAFVQSIFIGLFTNAMRQAGGDPERIFPLAAERAAPDRFENPQPVALSAWQRALSDRMFVIVRDTNHLTLVDDLARKFAWPAFVRGELPFAQTPQRTRKPTGTAAFAPDPPAGEGYQELGWAALEDGGEAYLPHVVRDWYALAWFDWQLKGDGAALARLASDDPFGAITHARKELPAATVELE